MKRRRKKKDGKSKKEERLKRIRRDREVSLKDIGRGYRDCINYRRWSMDGVFCVVILAAMIGTAITVPAA